MLKIILIALVITSSKATNPHLRKAWAQRSSHFLWMLHLLTIWFMLTRKLQIYVYLLLSPVGLDLKWWAMQIRVALKDIEEYLQSRLLIGIWVFLKTFCFAF